MELTLTKEQKRYLDKKGAIPAAALQKAYKNSVQDQQKTIRAAAKIRSKNTKR